jgi:hypothetical protein
MAGTLSEQDHTIWPTAYLLGRLQTLRAAISRSADWDFDAYQMQDYHAARARRVEELNKIKTVLATREHVPSKLERKLARQQTAAQNRGQKKSRNR